MASPTPSLWKQLFDTIDKRVSPTLNQLAASDDVATLAALSRRGRSELERRVEQASRRTLHMLNIPAGSDVNRLLTHIAALEREVRELRNELSDRENVEYLATLAERRQPTKRPAAGSKGGARGKPSQSSSTARKSAT